MLKLIEQVGNKLVKLLLCGRGNALLATSSQATRFFHWLKLLRFVCNIQAKLARVTSCTIILCNGI